MMKRTLSLDDEVVAEFEDLPRSQVPSLSALASRTLRFYLNDPAGFERAEARQRKQLAQAEAQAEEQVPA